MGVLNIESLTIFFLSLEQLRLNGIFGCFFQFLGS